MLVDRPEHAFTQKHRIARAQCPLLTVACLGVELPAAVHPQPEIHVVAQAIAHPGKEGMVLAPVFALQQLLARKGLGLVFHFFDFVVAAHKHIRFVLQIGQVRAQPKTHQGIGAVVLLP